MVKKGKKGDAPKKKGGKKKVKRPKATAASKRKKELKKKNPARDWKKKHPHLFQAINKNYSIGNGPQPLRDMGRMVKWPRYIRVARQRKILWDRLKVPPPINQFTLPLEKNGAKTLYSLLFKYQPETKKEKAKRLKLRAEKESKGQSVKDSKKPAVVKFGIHHVTGLIETKTAKLVIIANNVRPIELVVWMPALCKKMGVPYCIVKGKARLGQVVHQKTATCLAFTRVNKEDQSRLDQLQNNFSAQFNDMYESTRRKWGGGNLGFKARAALRKKEREEQKESKKLGHLLA